MTSLAFDFAGSGDPADPGYARPVQGRHNFATDGDVAGFDPTVFFLDGLSALTSCKVASANNFLVIIVMIVALGGEGFGDGADGRVQCGRVVRAQMPA